MITEVALQCANDGRHRKADEEPLVRVEMLTGLDQSSAGDLEQVLFVFAAV